MFFGESRAAYLEFLRNLTPQIIFLTGMLFFGEKINPDIAQFDWMGVKNLLPVLICAFAYYGSLIANSTLFLEKVINTNDSLRAELQKINARYLSGHRTILEIIKASWKLNKSAFFNGLIVFIVFISAQITVSLIALKSINQIH